MLVISPQFRITLLLEHVQLCSLWFGSLYWWFIMVESAAVLCTVSLRLQWQTGSPSVDACAVCSCVDIDTCIKCDPASTIFPRWNPTITEPSYCNTGTVFSYGCYFVRFVHCMPVVIPLYATSLQCSIALHTSSSNWLSFNLLCCVAKYCRSGTVFYLKTQFWGSTAVLHHLPPCRPPVQLHGSTSTLTLLSLTEASTWHTQHHKVRSCAHHVMIYHIIHMQLSHRTFIGRLF